MKVPDKTSFFAIILLLSIVAAGNSANKAFAESSSAIPVAGFTRDLSFGTRGNDVSALQKFLITGGFLKISTTTGYFGSITRNALGAWQKSVGIYPSVGFFGPVSRGKISTTVKQAPAGTIETPSPASTTTTATITTPAQSAAGAATVVTAPSVKTDTMLTTTLKGVPVRLIIPKLNIDTGFQYNGLKSDGTMEIPSNIFDAGWFTGSPHPGEKGVAIVTGHVAQIRGGVMTKPGVFSNLNLLSAGDKIYVVNDKKESIVFTVRESRSYDPAADATDVFTSKDGGVHLNLITCEGTWNPGQLSYSQRLVVFADAVQ